VLFDTLLNDFPPGEVRSVVAHELSHVRSRDVQRSLAWLALAAPAGLHLVQRLTERITGDEEPTPAALPALILALGVVSFGGGLAGNALSRKVEQRADAFALGLTEDPQSFIELEKRLAIKALADPQPPRLMQKLFGTHPDATERIGYAVTYALRPASS
jgi:STE24 endopeptidase